MKIISRYKNRVGRRTWKGNDREIPLHLHTTFNGPLINGGPAGGEADEAGQEGQRLGHGVTTESGCQIRSRESI